MSFDAIGTEDFRHPFVVSVQRQQPFRWVIKYVPFILPCLFAMPRWMFHTGPLRVFEEPLRVRHLVTAQIDTFLGDPDLLVRERETVYHHLMKPLSRHQVPSRISLIEEAVALLQAGSETVGATCAAGVFFVLNDPAVRKKLVDELFDAWPDKDSPVGYEQLSCLPYLVSTLFEIYEITDACMYPQTAVIRESLRLSHGVVTPLPRVLLADQVIGGYVVPAGVRYTISAPPSDS